MSDAAMPAAPGVAFRSGGTSPLLTDARLRRPLVALAALNFFLADARDGLGPFLDAYLATHGWSSMALGAIATGGGLLGMIATPLFGALVDGTRYKRTLVIVPVILVTIAALLTLRIPSVAMVIGGQGMTAVVGAVIGPALIGLTLGVVGEARFPDQVSRNEFWNHAGNVLSLAAIYVATALYGESGIVWLMIATALGAVIAAAAIDPKRIDHQVARGLAHDDGEPGPSGFTVLLRSRGLIMLAVVLLIFHFANAPISRLIAQQYSIELGTPFRTTALITGVAQLTMIGAAVLAPLLIRRFGLAAVFVIGLAALPLRGAIAGGLTGFWTVYPVQFLDGFGAGLLGIVTPVAAERILSGSGRFNVGLAAVMTVQGIGASLSNIVAGWLVAQGGYGLAYWIHGMVAVPALVLFVICRHSIAPPRATIQRSGNPADT
ncbi:MFS transporter [Sphingomonas alpina]|uniref:MFS transporter n=1 Tax=Sphingomonas alpina TaxID=653931 RepID=A0A7H0LML9_9SPHN|nr:MFS transporter [Sphingomonas alpina]